MKATIDLMHGDCLELMKDIPDGSVDLVLTDPPYGTMKNFGKSEATKKIGYKNYEWDDVIPIDKMFAEISRVLRQNGKAIIFGQEPFTSKLITSAVASVPLSYRAIWLKDSFGNRFMCNKAMVNKFEDICIFSKLGYDYCGENPLREYFKKVLNFIGAKSCKEINARLGHKKAEHCFYVTEGKKVVKNAIGGKADHATRIGSSQFELCTEQTYKEIVSVFGIDEMDGFLSFDVLREINENYKNKNQSIFNLWQGGKSKSNVLEYKKDNGGFHPTQKPVALLEDLIKTFSNEGNTVLDFTMGSGSTGVACVNTNRRFIGIELDDKYFEIAKQRINVAICDKERTEITIKER